MRAHTESVAKSPHQPSPLFQENSGSGGNHQLFDAAGMTAAIKEPSRATLSQPIRSALPLCRCGGGRGAARSLLTVPTGLTAALHADQGRFPQHCHHHPLRTPGSYHTHMHTPTTHYTPHIYALSPRTPHCNTHHIPHLYTHSYRPHHTVNTPILYSHHTHTTHIHTHVYHIYTHTSHFHSTHIFHTPHTEHFVTSTYHALTHHVPHHTHTPLTLHINTVHLHTYIHTITHLIYTLTLSDTHIHTLTHTTSALSSMGKKEPCEDTLDSWAPAESQWQ